MVASSPHLPFLLRFCLIIYQKLIDLGSLKHLISFIGRRSLLVLISRVLWIKARLILFFWDVWQCLLMLTANVLSAAWPLLWINPRIVVVIMILRYLVLLVRGLDWFERQVRDLGRVDEVVLIIIICCFYYIAGGVAELVNRIGPTVPVVVPLFSEALVLLFSVCQMLLLAIAAASRVVLLTQVIEE